MVIHRGLTAALFLFCISTAVFSEVEPTVELQVYNTLSMLDEENLSYTGMGIGTLTLEAQTAKNVKAELSLEGILSATPMLSIPRGYIKTRFPWFRMTFGKAPISWGTGFAFNAGDVLFRQFIPEEPLASETLRDPAAMQTTIFIPFGPFSFGELAVFPPEIDFQSLVSDPKYEYPLISETQIGSRLYFQAGPMTIEPGYLYDAGIDTHFPYLSLQGHLLADWHLSGSLGIETGDPSGEKIYQAFYLSCGGSYILSFQNGGSLTFRLESLLYPAGAWKETEDVHPGYGLLFYPEMNWSISDTVSLFVRFLISPIDTSALTTLGGNWNIFTGFDLLGFINIEGGDDSDTYAYGNPGWFSVTLGTRYIF